ncbi:hypothetical protein AK812_SmicGene15792 [Symbiodinium microadriaticum]|uniref:Uncharacterized protein n=1 Tax=Symbiodinium microadriaticum TaxID=2951 RepID=A0A1Q9E231_SYMMI|nr:hypothetical protein AK812_SmicGene15792 [Symbiodinium microadriaticum]
MRGPQLLFLVLETRQHIVSSDLEAEMLVSLRCRLQGLVSALLPFGFLINSTSEHGRTGRCLAASSSHVSRHSFRLGVAADSCEQLCKPGGARTYGRFRPTRPFAVLSARALMATMARCAGSRGCACGRGVLIPGGFQ